MKDTLAATLRERREADAGTGTRSLVHFNMFCISYSNKTAVATRCSYSG